MQAQTRKKQLKCAIYTRVSTDSQNEIEFNSCQAQTQKIRSFIDSQDEFTLFKIYTDGQKWISFNYNFDNQYPCRGL